MPPVKCEMSQGRGLILAPKVSRITLNGSFCKTCFSFQCHNCHRVTKRRDHDHAETWEKAIRWPPPSSSRSSQPPLSRANSTWRKFCITLGSLCHKKTFLPLINDVFVNAVFVNDVFINDVFLNFFFIDDKVHIFVDFSLMTHFFSSIKTLSSQNDVIDA